MSLPWTDLFMPTMSPKMTYVTVNEPVTKVYVGMKGSSISTTFEVISKERVGWKILQCVKYSGSTYEINMLTEDILRLCDQNKGEWIFG